MNKVEWEKSYEYLDKLHSDFLIHYRLYQDGRNRKIRDASKRIVDDTLRTAERYISQRPKIYELLTEEAGNSGYGQAIIYDEFFLPGYFGGDMSVLLRRIKDLIKSNE